MGKRNKSQRFVDTLTAGLVQLGAKEYKTLDSRKSFHLDTVVGNIDIHVSMDIEHCYTMFARFDNVEQAKEKFDCNPYSGKYNTHVGNSPDMTPEKAAEICLIAIEVTQPKKPNITDFVPIIPTKKQLACNAIRDMFFHKQYNGVVPTSDLEIVKLSKHWHSLFTNKGVKEAIQQLVSEGYINLDEKGENWLWGGEMHEMIFGDV